MQRSNELAIAKELKRNRQPKGNLETDNNQCQNSIRIDAQKYKHQLSILLPISPDWSELQQEQGKLIKIKKVSQTIYELKASLLADYLR